MKRNESYVFDTNVIISALLFGQSKPGQAFFAALDRGQILISAPVFHELSTVLSRDKFVPYLLREERELFLAVLLRKAVLIEIHERVKSCRDPKDDMLLELAVNGKATCIISGDEDLLELNPFRGMSIITPDEFLASL